MAAINLSSNWEDVWGQRYYAEPAATQAGYKPIPPIDIPIIIPGSTTLLAVSVDSQSAKQYWFTGAWMWMVFNLVTSVPGTDLDKTQTYLDRIPINEPPMLIQVPSYGSDFTARFTIPWRYDEIAINIYRYLGPPIGPTVYGP